MFDHLELQIGYVYQHALRSVLFIYCHIYIESACVTLCLPLPFSICNAECVPGKCMCIAVCVGELYVCICGVGWKRSICPTVGWLTVKEKGV